ncbi:EI24 domain-containing protein [Algicella marina]|uniref:Sulfate transporter family protein n=1 Tax=Algicella marina TaxID=2683284 RepID=A0A6P1T339_9RHOB|nr:EI24 domain-containing protein [Algicella marina]QHQ36083.1 hypothetical protein GO499_13310 [Algicella marina]
MAGDIAKALGQLGDPRFLAVLLKAMAVTLLVLIGFVWFCLQLFGYFLPETMTLPWIGPVSLEASWLSWAMLALALVASIFLMIPLASLLVGFFVEDVANAVEDRHYPHLPDVPGQGWAEMIWDTLRFLGLMILANGVALIVYFAVNVLAPFVFLAVNGLLLGREYFYLVAARRIGARGARALFRGNFAEVWLTGVVMAVPLAVPGLNLLIPVLGVAAFTHQFHRISGKQ